MTNIAVIGSGSMFSPELVLELSKIADKLGAITLRFIDNDSERQEVVSGLCRRLLKNEPMGESITIIDCTTMEECLTGAEFVLLQIRHGGIDSRIEDEKLGKKYKLPFTETISICGFATFLRTYYEYEKIGAAIIKYAPDALVLNFTNPSAQLAESLHQMGVKKVVGVCNAFKSTQDTIRNLLNVEEGSYFMNWRGLNHLTIVDGIYHEGKNRIGELLERLPDNYHGEFEKSMLVSMGALLNGYFQYYFNREKIIEKLQNQSKLRSELVKEIDGALFDEYRTANNVPKALSKRGGYGYATAVVDIIRAYCINEGSVHYAIVQNGSCLPSLPSDAFVEVPVIVNSNGVFPIVTEDLPDYAKALAIAIKAYERILIKAAKDRDKNGMLMAMMTHPLLNCYSVAKPLLDDCLEINRQYLPDDLIRNR
ncbi:MAG: hypothetical protein FWC32_02495 [Firmicutes bacterium]|nr:hypothetical protein [Bacillota bacterium]